MKTPLLIIPALLLCSCMSEPPPVNSVVGLKSLPVETQVAAVYADAMKEAALCFFLGVASIGLFSFLSAWVKVEAQSAPKEVEE